MLKRIGIFLLANFLIVIVLSVAIIVLGMLGFDVIPQYGSVGIVSAALFGFGGSFISLWISKWLAKRFMGVKTFDSSTSDSQARWIYDTVAKQADKANIKMPELGIFENPSPNAFATGSSRNNSLIAVSTGLLQQMKQDEVEAVLAHEVAHVANGDMVTMALLTGLLNTFVIIFSRIIGTVVDRVVFKNEDGPGMGYFIGYFVAVILLTFLASFVVAWFSRKREFKADSGGAYLAGKEKMIAALERLKQATNAEPMPDEMAAFCISNNGSRLMRLQSTHPPLEDRINALKNLA